MSRWHIELPGPFIVTPALPRFERSAGVVGFLFITLPWWLLLTTLALVWASIWCAIWVVVITIRLIISLFRLRPPADEPIDEPNTDYQSPNEWSDRR